MIAERIKAERLASILAALPNVFLASELPRPAARHSGGTREPTPRIAPGCVSGGMVDTLDLDGKRPSTWQPEGFAGR